MEPMGHSPWSSMERTAMAVELVIPHERAAMMIS